MTDRVCSNHWRFTQLTFLENSKNEVLGFSVATATKLFPHF